VGGSGGLCGPLAREASMIFESIQLDGEDALWNLYLYFWWRRAGSFAMLAAQTH